MILIDTSAWVEYLRASPGGPADEVRRQLSEQLEDVVTCEPVAMEILAGARDHQGWTRLEQLVNGLPSLDLDAATDFRAAAQLFRAARTTGRTVRSLNDCLIAALAIRHTATVLHRDVDFEVLAEISDLAAVSLR